MLSCYCRIVAQLLVAFGISGSFVIAYDFGLCSRELCKSGSSMAWVIKSSINPSFKPYFAVCVPAFSTHLRDYPGSLFGNAEVSYYLGH